MGAARVLCWFVVLVGWMGGAAAGTAQVGRGATASSIAPLYYVAPSPDDAGASRILYRKEDLTELPPNVPITAIEFDKRLSGALSSGTFTIYLKNTTATALATSPLSDALTGTQVFTTTATAIPAPDGWVRFELAAPFTYTGDSLELTTVWDSMSGARTADLFWGYHATGAVNTRLFNYGPDPLAPSDVLGTGSPPTRPNTRFIFTTPAVGWLVVTAGNAQLLDGATYANNATFSNGVTVAQKLTLTNNGGAAITFATGAITFDTITGTSPSVTTGPPASLAPGASAQIELAHAATVASGTVGYSVAIASSAGTFDYRLQGASFAAAPEIDVNVGDLAGNLSRVPSAGQAYFGNQVVGVPRTMIVQIANTGSAVLNLTGTTPVEVLSGPATVATQAPATVAAGTDATATITITCPALGACSTQLRVVNDDATESSYTVQLNLTAITAPVTTSPEIEVAYIDENAGMTPLASGGSHAARPHSVLGGIGVPYAITNTGQAALHITNITVASAVNCTPQVTSATTATLAAGASTTLDITAEAASAAPASFVVTIQSDDPDEGTFSFTVLLEPPAPDIELGPPQSGNIFIEGTSNVGSTTALVTVRNVGDADLVISDVAITMENNCGTGELAPVAPLTIPPGGSQDFTMTVAASVFRDAGPYSFRLVLGSNDPDESIASVTFAGEVVFNLTEPTRDSGCAATGPGAPSGCFALALALVIVLGRRRGSSRRG